MTNPKDGVGGLTATRLREAFIYDPETGLFLWNEEKKGGRWRGLGNPAGSLKPSGYILIDIDGHRYRAHRLAWLYMTGEWPRAQIDHVNGERADNRWVNLREATQIQNSANMKRRPNNKLGVKGVILYRGLRCVRYRANITINGKLKALGSFKTLADAQAAYEKAAREVWGDFARAA